jgi:hypothetical protein
MQGTQHDQFALALSGKKSKLVSLFASNGV